MLKQSEQIIEEIEKIVLENDINYIDAVILYCEKYNVDVENIAELIKKNRAIYEKIEADASDLRIIPKISKLPL